MVVDKTARSDVHGVYQRQPLRDTALTQALINLGRNPNEFPPLFGLEPEFFPVAFHGMGKISETAKGRKGEWGDGARSQTIRVVFLLGLSFDQPYPERTKYGTFQLDQRTECLGKSGDAHLSGGCARHRQCRLYFHYNR